MYIIDFSADIINKKVNTFIFLLEGKRKMNQKENLFNVSLTLHWASLRGSRKLQAVQRLETFGIWLVPSVFGRN